MDPFTIVVGVIGTLDAGTRLSSKASSLISKLKNAPADILTLMNELEDLRVVLNEAGLAGEKLEDAAHTNSTLHSALREVLQSAHLQIDELETIIDRTQGMKLQQRITWLRKQGNIEKRRAELRSCREQLRDILATHNV